MTDIKETLTNLVPSLGLGVEVVKIHRHADTADVDIVLRMPPFKTAVSVEEYDFRGHSTEWAMRLFKELEHHQRIIFAAVVAHMAKHDRSPQERLEMIEKAAKALIAAVESLGFKGRLNESAPMFNALETLRMLVNQKPGGLDWRTKS